MNNLKKDFASRLLKVKAIKLQPNDPFTWASGWKSPFYCDNRKTLAYPELRTFVKLELVHAVLENFSEAEAVAGVATGAIAQGALVADLISTGGSSLKAVEALRQAGCEVVGMVASYTYGFPIAEKAFADANVKLITLTDYEHVVAQASETGYIAESDIEVLNEWRKDPANWKK